MKIYLNAQLLSSLKRFHLRQGHNFFCRLVGISLEEDGTGTIDIYPVYRSLGFQHHKGQTILFFPWFKKEILVSFSNRGIEVIAVPVEEGLYHS